MIYRWYMWRAKIARRKGKHLLADAYEAIAKKEIVRNYD